MANTSKKITIVHWFRKGLRLHDNPALTEAISKVQTNPELFCLRPTFILDTEIIKWLRVGPNRWRFLQQSLQQLDDNLRSINTRLYVIRGNPDTVFPRIFIEWNIKLLTFEVDIEPYSRVRDEKIELLAKPAGVKIIQRVSHTIYDTEAVIRKNMGKAPLTYQKFLSVVDDLPVPGPSLPPPSNIPDSCKPQKDSLEIVNSTCYDVPTLHELGVEIENCGPCLYPGGESESLARLEKFLSMKQWICKFEKPNTSPNSLEPSTTVLSPYLKFGCLSSRLFYHKLREVLRGTKHSQPPVSLMGQLMWREFYYAVGAATNNFDKMVGNTVCCQVPWDENETFLNAWTNGLTGYPFIDAIMRQLRQEGWIHHLARHAVACFLTRGDLWISWEKGQKVFEELLLDADWALNAGNWMWLSASAFFHQFYRVYSPVAFGKKTDKNGDFIRKYVPEVAKMPVEYIYEPWKAPLGVQRQVNCVLGKDYPHRIVIHEDVYKNNISKMSEAYKNNKERINQSANMCEKRKQDAAVASPTKRANKNQQKITSMFKKK